MICRCYQRQLLWLEQWLGVINMGELISKKDLYDKIVKLELSALEQMKTLAKLGNTEEYNKMNAVLMERTAFKYDVFDAPTILEIPNTGIGDLSDGYHTFNQLYFQRMILFAALVKAYKEKAWKSYRHEDGEYCFGGGWFIVGIDTPEGTYTYHYENKYWDMFDCVDLPRGKHWDGHTEEDAETRLMSLEPDRWIPCKEKLPPNEKKTYWVCLSNGSQCECRWTNDIYGFGEIDDRWDWSYLDKPRYSTIVAWRELPEPMRLENK